MTDTATLLKLVQRAWPTVYIIIYIYIDISNITIRILKYIYDNSQSLAAVFISKLPEAGS